MSLTILPGQGIASFHHRYATDAEDMVVTIGARAESGALGQAHANRLRDAWGATFRNQMVATCSFIKCVLRVRQDGGGDIIYESFPAAPQAGAQAGAGYPPNVAIVVEKITSRAGRRGRGRMFIPGVPESNADDNGLLGTNATAWNNQGTSFLNTLAAAAGGSAVGSPVVPLLFHGPTSVTTVTTGPGIRTVTTTEGAAGPDPDVITGLVVDPKLATQRRRLR